MLFDLKAIVENQDRSFAEAACLCESAEAAGRIDQRGESRRLFLALAVFSCPDDWRRRLVMSWCSLQIHNRSFD
jgi:hypothetical protein